MKSIINKNDKGRYHGYQEWYYSDGKLLYKGFYNNDMPVDYQECYWDDDKLENKNFYI